MSEPTIIQAPPAAEQTDSVDALLASAAELPDDVNTAVQADIVEALKPVNDAQTVDQPVEAVPAAQSITEVTESPVEVPAPAEPTEPQPDLLDQIMERIVSVTEADKFMRVVIYGPPGQRKTSFCATAPKPLVFELDTGGTKSLMNDPLLAAGAKKLPFRSMFQFNTFLDYLVNDDPRLAEYETFIIDTYNGLQQKDLSEIPPMSDGKPNYNINTQNMKAITDKLKHVNKHVIITAHVREVKDDSTGRITYRPDLTDKVAAAVNADFDLIGYMTVQGGVWSLLVDSDVNPSYQAKTRIGGLPQIIENPNFPMILSAYETMRANAKKGIQ